MSHHRLIALLLPLLMMSLPAVAAYVMPPVAGVCTGDAGVGVGCGFDAAHMTAFSLTIAPKRAVVELPWCDESCYATCPPTYPIPYECSGCIYEDNSGKCFRSPYNVQSTAAPAQGGCYETSVAEDIDSYQKMIKKTQSSGGGFIFSHSSSTTTKKFYSMKYGKNYSMALSYKYILDHSVTLAPSGRWPKPTRAFKLAALLLPTKYKGAANKAAYRAFIDAFGTHFMSEAYMGASALLTNYFHSCFKDTFSSKEVIKASSSSFMGIFSDNKAKGWGSSISKHLWDSYSDINLKLNGGAASAYGDLGLNNGLDKKGVAEWQKSISADNMVPLTYELRPLTDAMQGGWIDSVIADNVNMALADYDAEIGVQNQQLQDWIVQHDHYKKPKWCKFDPDPPGQEKKDTSLRGRHLADLPGCPALPASPWLRKPAPRQLVADSNNLSPMETTVSTAAPTLPLISGLLSASGELGGLFGRGYDPIEMTPRGAVAEWHFDGWACKDDPKGQQVAGCRNAWRDPISGVEFAKPDELEIFNTPASESSDTQHLFVDASAYRKWHWETHSTTIGLGVFTYSHSMAQRYVSEILDTKRKVITVKQRHEIAYQMSMWDAPVLSCEMSPTCAAAPSGSSTFSEAGVQSGSSFAQQRAALPDSCGAGSSQAAEYRLFREAYGTHYVDRAVFGGSLQFVFVIDSELYTKMTETQLMEQTSIGFNLIYVQFGFNSARVHNTTDVSREFRQSTQVVLLAYGGNSLLLEEGNYAKWSASVPTNPAPINSTLRNITDLFDASDNDRRACMSAEVEAYLASKPPPRYRCGDVAGATKLDGIPKPSSTSMRVLELGSLPTLEEVHAGRRLREAKPAPAQPKSPPPAPPTVGLGAVTTVASADGACDPHRVIAGASSTDLIGKTFDVKTGMARLVATPLTCRKGKTWYSPYDGQMKQIPDQLDFVDVSAACQQETMTTISNMTSAWDYSARSFGFSIGIGLPLGDVTIKIGIGFQKQVADIASRMSNFTSTMTTMHRNMAMYRLAFGTAGSTPLEVGGMLQLALSNLPAIDGGYAMGSRAQRAKYDQFIQAFGTHYVAAAEFGAHCSFDTSLDKSFTSKMSSHYVSEQMTISIGIEMGKFGISADLGFGSIKNDTKLDKEFAQHARSGKICFGGNPALLSQNPPQYDKWVQSVYNAPAWINGTAVLRPIGDLIIGENAASKRECLQGAVIAYMEA